MEEYKVLKVRTLGSEEARASFDKAFYTLNDIYNQVIFYIDKYLIYYEMNENPHSEMSTMLLKRYNLPLYKPKQIKEEKEQVISKVHVKNKPESIKRKKDTRNKVKPKSIKEKKGPTNKLIPNKPFEEVHNLFLKLSTDNNRFLIIAPKDLKPFIYQIFDFNVTKYDNKKIRYTINTTAFAWARFFSDLLHSNYIKKEKSYSIIYKILTDQKFIITPKANSKITLSKSTLRAAFTSKERSESAKKSGHYIPINEFIKRKK